METKERKVGRPKAPPRTGPLVLGEDYAPERVNRDETARCSIYCRFSSVVGSGAFGGLIQTAVG